MSKNPVRRSMLGVESLETRENPAVIANVNAAGFLTMTIDNRDGDSSLVVSVDRLNQVVISTRRGPQTVIHQGTGRPAKATEITGVRVEGSASGDRIDLSRVNKSAFNRIAHNTVINGGDGNDTIDGSQFSDVIEGGLGHDTIRGQDGNDTLKGGRGNDTIYGGLGDDKIYAGGGVNVLFGDLGKDKAFDFDARIDKLYSIE